MWKRTLKSSLWLAASAAISCSMISFAVPVSSLNLESLCNSSDLIIVGEVGHFAKIDEVPVDVGQNTLNADLMESSVEVLSVLKGAEASQSILVQVTVMRPSWGSANLDGIPDGGARLLFLKGLGGDRYQVTDSYHPYLYSSRDAAGQSG